MNYKAAALLLLISSLVPVPALAADAKDIIDKVMKLQEERREGVNRYIVEQEAMGYVSKITFERTTVTGPDGEPMDTFQMVLPDNLMQQGSGEDQEFTLQTINAWIDAEEYVPLKLVMDGTMDTDGTPRPVTIENIERDYRNVPGSNMYEPYAQVMRLTGEMADETKKQMEEARAQLEEFDKQMTEMPESQRKMMMSMMGEQIEMMRKMAAGDGIEIMTNVRSITVE
jgi:hypothetical protein